MRIAPQRQQIVENVQWLSLVDNARQTLSPSVENVPTATTAPSVDLMRVHQRVFVGTPDDPGLLGPNVAARFVQDIPAYLRTEDVTPPVLQSQDMRPAGVGPLAPSPMQGGRAQFRRPSAPDTRTGTQFGSPKPRGKEVAPVTKSAAETEPNARILELADSLLPTVMTQTYSEVPLGYTEDDVTVVRTERYRELQQQQLENAQKINDLGAQSEAETDPGKRATIDAQIAALRTQNEQLGADIALESGKSEYAIAPGRAYIDQFDRALQDYQRQVREDPTAYTPELINSARTALSYTQQLDRRSRLNPARARYGAVVEDTQLVTPSDVTMIMRNMTPAQRRNLKEDLFYIYPSLEKSVVSMTSIDNDTASVLAEVIGEAQREGVDWGIYLTELKKSDRVRERATGSGGGFTVQLPSKDDVAALVQQLSRSLLGTNIPTENAASIAQQYVDYFGTTFRSQAGASTISEPMSAQTFVTQQLQEQYQPDYDVYQMGNQLDTFKAILAGQI